MLMQRPTHQTNSWQTNKSTQNRKRAWLTAGSVIKAAENEIANLKALDVVLYVALVQLRYEVGLVSVFPASFQSIEHDTTEFLDVVLLPSCTSTTITSVLTKPQLVSRLVFFLQLFWETSFGENWFFYTPDVPPVTQQIVSKPGKKLEDPSKKKTFTSLTHSLTTTQIPEGRVVCAFTSALQCHPSTAINTRNNRKHLATANLHLGNHIRQFSNSGISHIDHCIHCILRIRDVNTRVRWIPRPEPSIPGPDRDPKGPKQTHLRRVG